MSRRVKSYQEAAKSEIEEWVNSIQDNDKED